MRTPKTMMVGLAMLILAWAAPALAADKHQALGEKLVRQLWQLTKSADMAKLERMVSPAFQALHEDGARDRKQWLELVAKLDMGDYALSEFKTTRNGAVLMVTYWVAVAETIDGKRLPEAKPTPRLSGFIKAKAGWRLICHVNMRPGAK